jgi:glycosyltransferase involved in cell wall biosynthesis
MTSTMKVLYLLHDARRSGVPAVAVNFIRCAASVGVEPTVLFAHDGVYAQELRAAGIPVVTLGKRTPFIWRAKRFLMNWFLLSRAKHFDVIHVHSIKLAWSVLLARRLGARVVFHLHELPRYMSRQLRSAVAAADCVVFCSETCAAHFSGVPARSRRTIVNAMHFPDQLPVKHEEAGRRIVMVGSINKNKGQDILLKAFSLVKNRNAQLWFYGTTGLSAHGYVHELKRYSADHGLADRVFFPGPTMNAMSVFAEAALVVHTSWSESFGMALVEAQSCGVPVIAHDLEGMREVVIDGVTGYLIPPGDFHCLASRIDELLADPELRSKMGMAGYGMVRERFSIAFRMNDYRKLYEELCQN